MARIPRFLPSASKQSSKARQEKFRKNFFVSGFRQVVELQVLRIGRKFFGDPPAHSAQTSPKRRSKSRFLAGFWRHFVSTSPNCKVVIVKNWARFRHSVQVLDSSEKTLLRNV